MVKLLKPLLVVVMLVSGIALGDWLHAQKVVAAHGEVDDVAHAGDATVDDGPLVSFTFPNQFFVPIVRNGTLRSVMVLGLGLEVDEPGLEAVRSREFQLRDALLRALMVHANSGGFDGNFTSEPHLRLLGKTLLTAAHTVAGDEVRTVLIGDIARQEQ